MWKRLRENLDYWNAYEGEQEYMLRSMHERMAWADLRALNERAERAWRAELPDLEEMFWRLNRAGWDW